MQIIRETPHSTIIVRDVNPMMVLIGSTLKSGHPMFAAQLVQHVEGELTAVLNDNPSFAGMSLCSVAHVVDTLVKGRYDMLHTCYDIDE
jgi:hypothetical protein